MAHLTYVLRRRANGPPIALTPAHRPGRSAILPLRPRLNGKSTATQRLWSVRGARCCLPGCMIFPPLSSCLTTSSRYLRQSISCAAGLGDPSAFRCGRQAGCTCCIDCTQMHGRFGEEQDNENCRSAYTKNVWIEKMGITVVEHRFLLRVLNAQARCASSAG
ncbi:hypothetical protein EXIGLDRAFT_363366 [Exidia glandulosa HHB12029]|uniref:Uncharacterized protein n=1 Tax=Exidia glandulosa HHB12029 TaxID=1314781 RepID=A0A165C543_EXIGL|nr:hypothetical protein EXIGLDRAFT_363366 [Exidia glandulosa HHB12029]